ncbi:MAG: ThuA domain-containing protein [Rubripirellula sp.]|nr:ThuA domain-containing protein [Rubripirellula sp.]
MLTRSYVTFALLLLMSSSLVHGDDKKHILMIAGKPSHGYGSHEHFAGLKVLEQAINEAADNVEITTVKGWPSDESLVERADSIVIYCDGGERHLAIPHLDTLRNKLAEGCGLVCIHYAVEMVPGPPGDAWVEMLGGHFEIHRSVNPHWDADFKSMPTHPITHGVKPFVTNDEWYFYMRFKDSDNVIPILAAVAPESTMGRKDGPHSGNPAVRKSVAAGEPQTVAWAYERPDGGRSFGFTGGHHHWNWGNEDQLRVVTNAIRWTAGDEVSPEGSKLTKEIGMERLLENQDYDPPKNFNKEATQEKFNLQSSQSLPKATRLVADPSAATDQRSAKNAIAGLEIADGVEITLSASEPELRSLTNLDIDDRGRVWVCDVMNYRHNNGSRPEGDRILILEDTTGDGIMDSVKTFYQGKDIDSAMGICVLGNEVIVTATPTVWKFTDEDGDDKPDRKEAMFTQTGQPQHDHSAHSFLFGPDGKLYWNFGNTGKQVRDANGNTVVDIHGRPVVDNGQPLYGGMPFRCDLDGSNFEVLAHNFRNNWETAVDSFGAVWQSDNDDDGNRGTRINFVMEHGNYGYRDELTGAGWRQSRITMEDEVPHQHWHLNDPGVIPNMLQTGAGSPSGITVYEGRLLPERFWDQVVHCDPGPNVVRAYPAVPDGAGYSATIAPLMTGTTDKWFRPVDVCVAPDGSLFVTDWYDPGVGGHRQGDTDRGRLFRIAPAGTRYTVPKFDYSTAVGAVEALRNPNLAVRYKAWMALHAMGESAEAELLKLYADSNPRLRARALWLLGKIDGRGEHFVAMASADDDVNIRCTAIRLARQLGMTPSTTLARAAQDPSPAVRRELAVALRYDDSATMPACWAELAQQYDGKDRWYLEALGLSSDLRASECFEAWLNAIGGDWNTTAGRDIVWRIRAPAAADAMAQIIADPSLSLEDTNRYFRSLEYHQPATRNAALKKLLAL